VTEAYRKPWPEEAAAMARLHIACWREAYGAMVPPEILVNADLDQRTAAWLRHLADAETFVLAAFAGNEPVGFIIAHPNRDPATAGADGQIAALYVAAAHYRRGIGRRLMATAANWWRAQGGQVLGLGVLVDNGRARAFYESLGGRHSQTGNYMWDGHAVPHAIYLFEELARLGALS
jgi:ribosomal protein S18 acetylase RimI-like enzyme